MKTEMVKLVLYGVSLAMGLATVVLSYTGLPEKYDTEPLLGVAILCLALAGLRSINHKKLD